MRKRVLVVENELDTQNTLQALLEMADCDVDVASDGIEALQKLENATKPALIFLDLMMPRMDGYTFVQELRKKEAYLAIPIVVVSGDADVKKRVKQMGMDVFISKPFDIDEVLDVVDALVKS